jgi:glycine cleavage system aminomethyltransferase T
MKKRISKDEFVMVNDVTGAYAQINIQGPTSRDVVQAVTSQDMSNEAFPFRCSKDIDIGYGRALCTRITYVGELGYELFVPAEFATHVYDRILEHGQHHGLRHAGLRALNSLRLVSIYHICTMWKKSSSNRTLLIKNPPFSVVFVNFYFLFQEKAYRDYGHDLDNTNNILESGLGFTCDFEKDGGFIGMEHVLAQKRQRKSEGGLRNRIAQVLVKDPEPLLHHGEIVWRNGSEAVCEVRSASYGHTLGGAVGLVMLTSDDPITKDYMANSTWEVETPNGRHPCKLSFAPLYDPNNKRIKV